ncbi:MAG: hypothetical protein AAF621_07915 [Pseudomonadota bacterium]
MDFINYFFDVATQIIVFASVFTAFTHTPQDDGILYKLYHFIEKLALVTEKTKQKGKADK